MNEVDERSVNPADRGGNIGSNLRTTGPWWSRTFGPGTPAAGASLGNPSPPGARRTLTGELVYSGS